MKVLESKPSFQEDRSGRYFNIWSRSPLYPVHPRKRIWNDCHANSHDNSGSTQTRWRSRQVSPTSREHDDFNLLKSFVWNVLQRTQFQVPCSSPKQIQHFDKLYCKSLPLSVSLISLRWDLSIEEEELIVSCHWEDLWWISSQITSVALTTTGYFEDVDVEKCWVLSTTSFQKKIAFSLDSSELEDLCIDATVCTLW